MKRILLATMAFLMFSHSVFANTTSWQHLATTENNLTQDELRVISTLPFDLQQEIQAQSYGLEQAVQANDQADFEQRLKSLQNVIASKSAEQQIVLLSTVQSILMRFTQYSQERKRINHGFKYGIPGLMIAAMALLFMAKPLMAGEGAPIPKVFMVGFSGVAAGVSLWAILQNSNSEEKWEVLIETLNLKISETNTALGAYRNALESGLEAEKF